MLSGIPCLSALRATQAWPRDALEAVARKALRQAELAEAERETLVALCQDFHRKASSLQRRPVHAPCHLAWLSATFSHTSACHISCIMQRLSRR